MYQTFRGFLFIVDIEVYITISVDILSTTSSFYFCIIEVCVFSCHEMSRHKL